MDFLTSELKAGEFAPILLGNSTYSKWVSRRFFAEFGLISHVFCQKISLMKRLSASSKFHIVNGFYHDELLLKALTDFANGLQQRDIILYLIPGTADASIFVNRNRARLEPNFIIASPEALAVLMNDPQFEINAPFR